MALRDDWVRVDRIAMVPLNSLSHKDLLLMKDRLRCETEC